MALEDFDGDLSDPLPLGSTAATWGIRVTRAPRGLAVAWQEEPVPGMYSVMLQIVDCL